MGDLDPIKEMIRYMSLKFSLYHELTVNEIFFFNETATTEIYPLSLHDALPICGSARLRYSSAEQFARPECHQKRLRREQSARKSTRLNSSHLGISYAVFCL